MHYRKEIDGLRAIAILPVILFHAGFEVFGGGFVGVDIFFVISGYLITNIISADYEKGNFSIKNFYEKRARRILPALFFVIIVCIFVAWFLLLPSDMNGFSRSLVAVSIFASNILFWRESSYFDSGVELKPLLHTWSLAIEEQYYIVYPILLLLLLKLGRIWILSVLAFVFLASLVFSEWATHAKPVAAFYLLPMRAWELLIGAFAAFYLSKNNGNCFQKSTREIAGWLGLGLIAYAIFFYSKATPFPGFNALVPTFGAMLVIVFATHDTTAAKFLGNKAFVGIGLISYSAYLWHQPLFAFARYQSMGEPNIAVFILLLLITFILAYVSWRFVEAPFRSQLMIKRSSIFILAILFSLIFILFGLLGIKSNGFKFRVSSDILNKMPDMSEYEKYVSKCWKMVESSPNISSSCILGRDNKPVIFGVLGDSHAGGLLHILDQEAIRLNIQGRNFSYRSCPPLSRAKPTSQDQGALACNELRKDFFKVVSVNPSELPNVIIVSARWSLLLERDRFNNGEGGVEQGGAWLWDVPNYRSSYYENMRFEIIESLKILLNTGKLVILIYPVPEMGWDVPKLLSKKLLVSDSIPEAFASTSHEIFLRRNKTAVEVLDSIDGGNNLVRIKPELLLCNTIVKDRCVAHINGEALYFDNNHLNNLGVKLVLQDVVPILTERN
jgi:peptidoglycan/LPS O-acetylase OafA/YrhL